MLLRAISVEHATSLKVNDVSCVFILFLVVPQMMAIPHAPITFVDKKDASQIFICKNYRKKIQHMFVHSKHLLAGKGECCLHKRQDCVYRCNQRRPTILFLGPDCAPFTYLRPNQQVTPEDHPAYATTFGNDGDGSAAELIEKYLPDAWVLENVWAFAKRRHSKSGDTYSQEFAKRIFAIQDNVDGSVVQCYPDVQLVKMQAEFVHGDLERVRREPWGALNMNRLALGIEFE